MRIVFGTRCSWNDYLIAAVAMALFSIIASLMRLVVLDVYESLSTTALSITENTYDARRPFTVNATHKVAIIL